MVVEMKPNRSTIGSTKRTMLLSPMFRAYNFSLDVRQPANYPMAYY